jgi:Ricin-type beta-trefoil lectin domain
LDTGFRAVELDVIDRGDWEFQADGPYVSHGLDAGNRNCSGDPDRLGHCLRDILAWLDTSGNEGPILVFVDLKASWDPANAWYPSEVRLLDDKIRQILGHRMYTASELYAFAAGRPYAPGQPSLRSVVSANGWPLLGALSDRVIVAYTGGRLSNHNQTQAAGIENILASGRLPYGFFCPDVESTPPQIVPGGTVDGVSNATSQFFVCSNLKARDHYQVVANASHTHKQLMHIWDRHVYDNDSYAYNYIAVAHGISAIGRDGNAEQTWSDAIPLVGVRRSLPGYFELRPTYATGKCMTVNGSGNGSRIDLRDCNGSLQQRFVYTAEGQLRPRHANTYCTDISGGSAGNLINMHLWDCDGGSSEKWPLESDGRFRSFHNGLQFCMSAQSGGTANGTRFVTAPCGSTAHPQFFRLQPVADWPQTSF